jgi:hypothetical protein
MEGALIAYQDSPLVMSSGKSKLRRGSTTSFGASVEATSTSLSKLGPICFASKAISRISKTGPILIRRGFQLISVTSLSLSITQPISRLGPLLHCIYTPRQLQSHAVNSNDNDAPRERRPLRQRLAADLPPQRCLPLLRRSYPLPVLHGHHHPF